MSVTLALVSVVLLAIAVVGYFEMRRYVKKMNMAVPLEKYRKALIIRVVIFCSALVAVNIITLVSIIMRWF